MSKKLFFSALMVCGFAVTETTILAKEKKAEFKYKAKYGDVSREFMSDIVGNTKGYVYDFAKNFKKQPELFLSAITALVSYGLYKSDVDTAVTTFVYGGKDCNGVVSPDHKKEIVIATAALAVASYIFKDKINETYFAEQETKEDRITTEEVVTSKED